MEFYPFVKLKNVFCGLENVTRALNDVGEKHMDDSWHRKCSKGTKRPRERKECGASVYTCCFSGYKSTTTKDTSEHTRRAIVCIRYM